MAFRFGEGMRSNATVESLVVEDNKEPEKPIDREKMDATLKELTSLVKEVNPDARRKGTFFDFAIVYPDPRSPTHRLREIGTTCSGRKSADDTVTLASKKFQIGDFLDIAITPPRQGPIPSRPRRPY